MARWQDAFTRLNVEEVEHFLAATGRVQYDPNAEGGDPDDVFFWLTREQIGLQAYAMSSAANNAGRSFHCYPVIVDDPHPNAFARELASVHLIGLNVGLVSVAYEIAAYAMSRGDTFDGIGNPADEIAPELPHDAMLGYWIFDRVASGQSADTPAGAELLPRDPLRRVLAHSLSHLLMRFAWFHELFHCLNGHCGLLRASGITSELRELPTDDGLDLVSQVRARIGGMDPGRILHAFELDADACALRAMIALQISGAEPLTPFDEQPLPIRLRLVIAASWLMTFLFAQAAKRPNAASGNTHPPSATRLMHLVMTLFAPEVQEMESMHSVMQAVLDDLDGLRRHFQTLWSSEELTNGIDADHWNAILKTSEHDLVAMRDHVEPFMFRPDRRATAPQSTGAS